MQFETPGGPIMHVYIGTPRGCYCKRSYHTLQPHIGGAQSQIIFFYFFLHMKYVVDKPSVSHCQAGSHCQTGGGGML